MALTVGVLAVAGVLARGGGEEPRAPERAKKTTAAPAESSYGALPTKESTRMPEPLAPAPVEPLPAARAAPPSEGYREAREASWEGSLSGQVMSSGGPVAGLVVRVEWMLARNPDRDDITRMKRIGARRERDGSWWAKALATTDDAGCFTLDGLPAVPLRIHAGNVVQQGQVGAFAQIRAERPQ